MSGIGKQFKGSGIAKVGFQSKHEQARDHLKSGGLSSIGNLRIPRNVRGRLDMLADGGKALKPVDKEKNPGLSKLPTEVKHKIGYMKKGGRAHYAEGSKWIQGAIKHPGALRASLHVKAGEKIPAKKLAAAAKKPGVMGKRARLAQTLKGFKK